MDLLTHFIKTRAHSEAICRPLKIEDYVPQPILDVSPPKWHIAHTTWFFENFILCEYDNDYSVFNPIYNFYFNSYYENVGERVARNQRGFMTRPTVEEVYAYRKHVDKHMITFMESDRLTDEIAKLIVLGINHEQQHQELLWTDIKYILGIQPTKPSYKKEIVHSTHIIEENSWVDISSGKYRIGFQGNGFCFDNELGAHETYVSDFKIQKELVTNEEYLEFIKDGGYNNVNLWHSEAWTWISENNIKGPLYWEKQQNDWYYYEFSGLKSIPLDQALCHISYYEASAFAEWAGGRLPSEKEWEIAADDIKWGDRWEWTNSAYLAYPGYQKAEGAIGEYNGKFMISQMVLRGGSIATPVGHTRKTYRNFWHPWHQFQFSGIRLAK